MMTTLAWATPTNFGPRWTNMSYLVLFFVLETQTRRSSLEPLAIVSPRLIWLKLHHISQSSSARKRENVEEKKSTIWIQQDELVSAVSRSVRAAADPPQYSQALLQIIPVIKWCALFSFSFWSYILPTMVVLRRCQNACSYNSLTSVVSERRPADLRAAQQCNAKAAYQHLRYIKHWVDVHY